MLTYLCGEVTETGDGRVIVENHGIGYELMVPAFDLDRVVTGEQTKFYTFVQLLEREGTFQAFGFRERESLALFRLLLGVSGVGPRAALGILSALTPDTLRFAVLSEDAATIAKAPGIGKKTAQKLILELKDKIRLEEAFEQKLAHTAEEETSGGTENRSEAVEALTALGYSGSEALRAVQKVRDGAQMDVEALLRAALKYL